MTDKNDIQKWADKWDEAQKKGVFNNGVSIQPLSVEDNPLDSAKDLYWKNINREIGLLQEDHAGTPANKEDLAHQSQDQARAANPVYHHTVGSDQDLKPWTPNWIDGKELEELTKLKADLYDLENELNKKDALGESSSEIQTKIKSMWEKLNRLSNDLTPNRFKEILD